MLTSRFRRLALAGALLAAPVFLHAQGATTLGPLVQGLGVSGRVLVIAAHPDDEDTQLIAWLTKGRSVETAYLSLTRGDGGQNLIGNELGEALGAIRTEELLAARRLDGARQYFTRAFDFGYSKNAEETLTQWSRDSVLRDVITVVRQFRPQVIVAGFSGTPADGHGHHQVSGIFAREAYDAAGDTVRFPRAATAGFGPWTVSKFYRGAFFRNQERATIRMNVGEYNAILGRSYSEIASDSRSQHKSQAMGSLQQKGARFDQLVREASRAALAPADAKLETSIFDGVDTTWARFAPMMQTAPQRTALDALPAAFARARSELDLTRPASVVPALARVWHLLGQLCADPPGGRRMSCTSPGSGVSPDASADELRAQRASDDFSLRLALDEQGDFASSIAIARARLSAAMAAAVGLEVEATASREVWAIGEQIPVVVRMYNRGSYAMTRLSTTVVDPGVVQRGDEQHPLPLSPDSSGVDSLKVTLPNASEPWWLVSPRIGAMFTPRVLGTSETSRRNAATIAVRVVVEGLSLDLVAQAPVVYRYADPIKGEIRRPIVGAPAVTLSLDDAVAYAQANTPIQRALRVYVRSHASAARDVVVRLQLPAGLIADSVERKVSVPAIVRSTPAAGPGVAFGIGGGAAPEVVRTVTFNVRGRLTPGRHLVSAVASSNGQEFSTGYTAIEYDHIRTQRLYRPATLGIEAVDVKLPRALTIAYITGVGDNVAPMLEQLGVNVTVLDPTSLPRTDLSKFGAVVVGPRAYESNESLVANNARLLDYAREGGTLVVQYGQYEMTQAGIMPYPITLGRPADRVTVENAPVTIIDPSASILAAPNKISVADFGGWLQDRTIYTPRTFDSAYRSVFETHDPGEAPNQGALLVAPLGKGTYVYTTFAFFRQLPNGVPGAARLLINLLSAKADRVQP